MYWTRKRGEEDTGASETGKKLTLRLLALRVSRGHRHTDEDVSRMPGERGTANNREIRRIYGVSCKYVRSTVCDER